MLDGIFLKILLFVFLAIFAWTNGVFACTTVIVGKGRSADGSVMIAHNEDLGSNAAEKVVINPEHKYGREDVMQMYYGALLPQPEKTWRYAATTIFEKSYYPGDYTFGVNEKKVAVANNAASLRGIMSYEESIAYKNPKGIIWTELSQLVLERAASAREGVLLIGKIVEQYGLMGDSATMLGIADKDEGWWMEIAGNGQWVAKRVGDNEVVMRANGFRIGEIDFSDENNWLYSKRIIDCAIEQGWYKDGETFSFKDIYGEPARNNRAGNTIREKFIDGKTASMPKIALADLMQMMREAYEGTEEYIVNDVGSPFHSDNYTIANEETDVSAMVALEAEGNALGECMWVCMANPATGVYVPVHLGASSIYKTYANAREIYSGDSAYWRFTEFERIADLKYGDLHDDIAKTWEDKESVFLKKAAQVESKAQDLYKRGKTAEAATLLTDFDKAMAEEADKCLDKMLSLAKSEVYKRD